MASLTSINITTTTHISPEVLTIKGPDILSSFSNSPAYFLPQALSNSLNFHLNQPEPPLIHARVPTQTALNSTLRTIFDVTRSPLGESWTLVNMRRTTGRDVVEARGGLEFHSGYIYGGTYEGSYSIVKDGFEPQDFIANSSAKDPLSDDIEGGSKDLNEERISKWGRDLLPTEREFDFTLRVDDLGKQNGVWKIFDGTNVDGKNKDQGRIIAEEVDHADDSGRPAERLRFVAEIPDIYGFKEQEIKDFVVACWVCKVWRTRNRKGWFANSVRNESKETKDMRTW